MGAGVEIRVLGRFGVSRGGGYTRCRPLTLWRAGVLDALPDRIDHTMVGTAHDWATGTTALLMRDVSDYLVPVGNGRIPLAQHRRFLDHMAALHAAFLGFTDEQARKLGLLRPGDRYTVLTPAMTQTPMTLVHGDWKAGNLGTRRDGRTILLDWAWPGRDGPCVDLAWYLAVNCDLLPEPKEAAIEAFRAALHAHGVPTLRWWDRQLNLALLGAFVQLGWSKTHDETELGWWVRRTLPTARQIIR